MNENESVQKEPEISFAPDKDAPPQNEAKPAAKRKKKGGPGRVVLKIIIWLAVIAGIILLTLFLAAKISQLGTIPAVIDYIISSVNAL